MTVDADAFFFLHDLITSYLKEKEKVVCQWMTIFYLVKCFELFIFLFQLSSQNYRASSPNPSHSPNLSTNASNDKSDQPSTSTAADSTADGSNSQSKKGSNDKLQAMLNSKSIGSKLERIELEIHLRDWRNFECQIWHLEPTVRLLSWAGKSIEPYGIDYILNKLGFSHARTTIPKWLQRGFMDPLDSVEAMLIVQLLSLVKDDSGEKTKKEKE